MVVSRTRVAVFHQFFALRSRAELHAWRPQFARRHRAQGVRARARLLIRVSLHVSSFQSKAGLARLNVFELGDVGSRARVASSLSLFGSDCRLIVTLVTHVVRRSFSRNNARNRVRAGCRNHEFSGHGLAFATAETKRWVL